MSLMPRALAGDIYSMLLDNCTAIVVLQVLDGAESGEATPLHYCGRQ